MADTVDLDNIEEFEEPSEIVHDKVNKVVELIKNSKQIMIFTGAGISTSAQIPDFRGPNGVWTREAQKKSAPECVSLEQAIPTVAHMAIAELVSRDVVSYVVSQNIDGLHRRSGIPANKISELHGNCYLEVCWTCKAEYLRTFDVNDAVGSRCSICRERVPYFCHCTQRYCTSPSCQGAQHQLKDTIIHFEEQLPQEALDMAFQVAKTCDLCIVLGSSLTVTPACDIPKLVVQPPAKKPKKKNNNNKNKKKEDNKDKDKEKEGGDIVATEEREGRGKLVIINLQKTPLDKKSDVRIFGKTDGVMEKIMKALDIPIVAFANSKAAEEERNRVTTAKIDSVPKKTKTRKTKKTARTSTNTTKRRKKKTS